MGKHSCCVKQKLRKGLWSPEEDEKLFNHMTRYGTNGCWSSVPKLAGLQRCGKSCRLRWLNYLRPNLKRGTFSPDEEDIILNLHKILGNRWSQIAAQLPGRTDNEIKNFWNSYLKKKLIKQGIDPATHKPLADVNKEEKALESILASEELRTRVSSLRAYEPTFLIDDAFSENNIGLVDNSSRMMNGSGSGCSLPFPECQAGIEMDVYNPSIMMDQYHSNLRSVFNYQNHNPAAEMSPGIEFSCMPSLMNFEIDTTSKECSSNKSSNISSYSSGFQTNDASECDQAFDNCFLQFQVKSEDDTVPDSWLLEEHLMNTDAQSPVNFSSYQLTSISEDHMKAGAFGLFDQL